METVNITGLWKRHNPAIGKIRKKNSEIIRGKRGIPIRNMATNRPKVKKKKKTYAKKSQSKKFSRYVKIDDSESALILYSI